jgi:sugar phosphate permease
MQKPDGVRQRKVFYGWWMVLAGFISSSYLHAAYVYGFSALFNPILNTFGWTRATVAIAFSLQRGEAAVAAPLVGYFVDRFGPRPMLLIGAGLISLGFISLSFTTNLVTFYLSFGIIAIGTSFGFQFPNAVALNIWFNRYRTRALSILSMGSGVGGIATPLIVLLIEAVTWRGALRILALGVLIICIPTALAMRHRPEDYGYIPDGDDPNDSNVSLRSPQTKRGKKRMYTILALRSRIFWQLSIGLSLGFMMATVFVVFSIPAFESRGLTAPQAGLAVTGAVLISLIGRALSGVLGDKLEKRYVLTMGLVVLFIGAVAFSSPSEGLFPIISLVVCYGIGQGLLTPVRFAMVADYFDRDAYGELTGLMNTVSAVFSVSAPFVIGKWADATDGDFRMPFLFAGFVCLTAIPIILLLKPPDHLLGEEAPVGMVEGE